MTYITAHAQGYNDSTVYDILVAEDDSTEQDFQLLHPEFNPNRWELFSVLDPGLETELGFTMTNTGNGPLNWTVERRLIGDANAVPWEFRRSYPVGNIGIPLIFLKIIQNLLHYVQALLGMALLNLTANNGLRSGKNSLFGLAEVPNSIFFVHKGDINR